MLGQGKQTQIYIAWAWSTATTVAGTLHGHTTMNIHGNFSGHIEGRRDDND